LLLLLLLLLCLLSGFMPYTKIAPERLRAGHKGDLSYLMGKKVKARIVQVGAKVTTCI
jgi:hypothetical protein